LWVRHLGNAPLIEDKSVRSRSTTLVNAGLSYDFGRVQVGVELLNLLDSKDNDITYLQGEAAGVEGIHLHPVEPSPYVAGPGEVVRKTFPLTSD
jgi:hypothetical protein